MNGGPPGEGFFGDPALDQSLPAANALFWRALLAHIERADAAEPRAILDIGAHSGGLLAHLAERFPQAALVGIEPSEALRATAAERLPPSTRLLHPTAWHEVEPCSIDLVVCHEVLYLVSDLGILMSNVRRVLTEEGSAWVVLGCHTDNPVWHLWKRELEADGTTTYDYGVFDVLTSAREAGLECAVQPLRTSGWIYYEPDQGPFSFPTAPAMFDHHYRHKLLFRLVREDAATSP